MHWLAPKTGPLTVAWSPAGGLDLLTVSSSWDVGSSSVLEMSGTVS